MSPQVVIVTGAASGIGAATAISFAKLNAALCITDINEKNLRKTSIECQKLTKSNVLEVVADMRKDGDVENIVKSTLKKFGRIDALINCAGIYAITSIQDADVMEKFDKVFDVNLKSIVNLTNKALPSLIENKGCVINISSVGRRIVFKGGLIYSMSKAALSNFTRYAASELASLGVRVNSIAPGLVRTNIYLNSIAGATQDDNKEVLNSYLKVVPMNKFVEPEEIAYAAVYLASDKAKSITGTELVVDAGAKLGIASI